MAIEGMEMCWDMMFAVAGYLRQDWDGWHIEIYIWWLWY